MPGKDVHPTVRLALAVWLAARVLGACIRNACKPA
jgi:hypothetical protein